MIIITGANGQLGRDVTARLAARLPAGEVGVSVRDPEAAQGLEGVRVRRGDFAEPASLAHAFEGASQVLLVSASTTGGQAVQWHRAAIAAAAEAGAQRVVYTSHMGASPTSAFPPMPDHAGTEAALEQSGLAFTALRNGFYTASAAMLLRGALQTGELAVPEDGPVAWTTHADLAEAAARVLHEGGLDGVSPALTAGAALDMEEVAAIASEVVGREIRRVVVSDAAYRDALLAHGAPEHAATLLVGLFAASRRGDFAGVDPTLERLLGRPPQSFAEGLRELVA